jgi:hypothetical protein
MSQRVLIVAPRFHYFMQCVAKAFEALGWETQVETYDNPVHPYTRVNRWRYKLSRHKEAMRQRSRLLYGPEIETAAEVFCPDFIFLINGDNLLPDVVRRLRALAPVALWLFDSLVRMPQCAPNLTEVDEVFCYERQDLPLIRERYGVEAHFLPQAVDTDYYHPIPGMEKRYDLVFAGDLYSSQRRRRLMQAVVRAFPELKIRVWGIYKPWYKNPWRWLTREHREIYTNCNATAEQLNHDYNAARIVLNIHGEQQRDGANPKVYEIAASGAFQICDSNPYIDSLFPNGEVALYHNEEELIARIREALRSDTTARSARACREVTEHHTFTTRMKQVVDTVFSE